MPRREEGADTWTGAEAGSWLDMDAGARAADRAVHLIGVAAGLAGAAFAIISTIRTGAGGVAVAAMALYAFGLVAMLGCSAAYNLSPPTRHRGMLRRLDHAAIFIMIAGTYSPFTMVLLDRPWSVLLTTGIWTVATVGAALKLFWPHRLKGLSILLYLALGWAGLGYAELWLEALEPAVILLVVAGGIIYSTGVVIYLLERLRFHRALWHAFVLLAAGCHFAAIMMAV